MGSIPTISTKNLPKIDMRISHRKKEAPSIPHFRCNQEITAPEVRVIDENNNHLGVFPLAQALAMAQDKGLDLIEINPKANPPVVQIKDYGQFKYQQEKELRLSKAHQKKVELKIIRLSLRISQHDIDIRLEQTKKFLEEGNKVRIEIILKGREKMHQDLANKIIQNFIEKLENIRIEQPISKQGNTISALISKK